MSDSLRYNSVFREALLALNDKARRANPYDPEHVHEVLEVLQDLIAVLLGNETRRLSSLNEGDDL